MNIGKYVRTENGVIAKVNKIIDCANGKDFEYIDQEYYLNSKKQIVISNDAYYRNDVVGCLGKVIKSSPNIIDLIEEGDYVNGILINEKYIDVNGNTIVKNECDDDYYSIAFENKNIKSIVTKEEFKSIEYRIGE